MDIAAHVDSPLTLSTRQRHVFTVEPGPSSIHPGMFGYRGITVGGYAGKDEILTYVRGMLEKTPTLQVKGVWSREL